jgi:deoxyinosine 3'endonuclease (endonuclease V)
MLLAIDVYYIDNRAKSVGVLFHHWTDLTSVIEQVITDYQDNVEPYQSGQFYQRELPCIMSPVIFTQLFTKTLTVMRYMILMMAITLNFKN